MPISTKNWAKIGILRLGITTRHPGIESRSDPEIDKKASANTQQNTYFTVQKVQFYGKLCIWIWNKLHLLNCPNPNCCWIFRKFRSSQVKYLSHTNTKPIQWVQHTCTKYIYKSPGKGEGKGWGDNKIESWLGSWIYL